MLLLGIDLGTSSVKISVVDIDGQGLLASVQYPMDTEANLPLKNGWAEQSPDEWWQHCRRAIAGFYQKGAYSPKDITVIGIVCQMQGMVLVDKSQAVLYSSITCYDSQAEDIGGKAFEDVGQRGSITQVLESPGNFTTSKLAWVQQNQPAIYERIDKVMLPADYIAMKLIAEMGAPARPTARGGAGDFRFDVFSKNVVVISMPE